MSRFKVPVLHKDYESFHFMCTQGGLLTPFVGRSGMEGSRFCVLDCERLPGSRERGDDLGWVQDSWPSLE